MNSNARMWKKKKNTDANGNVSCGIYETFYNESGEVCGVGRYSFNLAAEDTTQLKERITDVCAAITKPLLEGKGFVFASSTSQGVSS